MIAMFLQSHCYLWCHHSLYVPSITLLPLMPLFSLCSFNHTATSDAILLFMFLQSHCYLWCHHSLYVPSITLLPLMPSFSLYSSNHTATSNAIILSVFLQSHCYLWCHHSMCSSNHTASSNITIISLFLQSYRYLWCHHSVCVPLDMSLVPLGIHIEWCSMYKIKTPHLKNMTKVEVVKSSNTKFQLWYWKYTLSRD